MSKNAPLSEDEARELFSELDDSGVIDPVVAHRHLRGGEEGAWTKEDADRGHLLRRQRREKVDPLSEDDPSGSTAGRAISRTAILCILGVLVFVVGMQVVYGVNRRLNTANLSEAADIDTVTNAMRSGVEWGNGFTQFPSRFTVDEADERTGTVEVSVVDTDSKNELELLSNSQIQASALSTNALLNEKINRVVYNVYALIDEDGNFAHDKFFGFIPAKGTRKAMLTFIWTKEKSGNSSYIDWNLKIVGMNDKLTSKISEQVNSVSSIVDDGSLTQDQVEQDEAELQAEGRLHGSEIFRGGSSGKKLEDILPTDDSSADSGSSSTETSDSSSK